MRAANGPQDSTRREIPHARRRELAKSLDFYRDTFGGAKSGMMSVNATGDYTLQQIVDVFGVHSATVSRAVNRK